MSTKEKIVTPIEDTVECVEALAKIVKENKLSKIKISTEVIDIVIEGECRFLRALYYFDMVRAWGDVPLVLKPVTVAESYTIGRTPAAEVYGAIIEDLKHAAANLPSKQNARFTGAASAEAANTLLAEFTVWSLVLYTDLPCVRTYFCTCLQKSISGSFHFFHCG